MTDYMKFLFDREFRARIGCLTATNKCFYVTQKHCNAFRCQFRHFYDTKLTMVAVQDSVNNPCITADNMIPNVFPFDNLFVF